jgi:hypothetical protein
MRDDREWIVPMTLVRHADAAPREGGAEQRASHRPECVAVLRGRVREGYYASASMMDAVARRILSRGDV